MNFGLFDAFDSPPGSQNNSFSVIYSASVSSDVTGLSLPNVFSKDYNNYKIILEGVRPNTVSGSLNFQFMFNQTKDGSSAYYNTVVNAAPSTSATNAGVVSTIVLTSGKGCNIDLSIYNINDTVSVRSVESVSMQQDSASGFSNTMQGTLFSSTNQVNGIFLLWGGASPVFAAAGRVRVYGLPNG
jgi:hypothetical protein